MRRIVRVTILLGLLNLLLAQDVLASPWPRTQYSFFTATGTEFFTADGDFIFDVPPLIDSQTDRFQRIQTNTYIEFGLTDRWLISFKANYALTTVTSPNSVVTSNGFTAIEGLIQRTIWQSPNNFFSVALSAGQDNAFSGGVRPGLQSDGIDGEVRVLYGRNFSNTPFSAFATAELAYRRRFGSAADQIRADFKLGAQPHPRVLVLADFFTILSARNEDIGGADFDVIKIQPSVAVRTLGNWRVQTGVNFEVAGRNLDRGNSVFVSLWSSF